MTLPNNILAKALSIIANEVDKLEVLSGKATHLDRSEASILTDYVKTLVSVRKDERDIAKSDDIQGKSDEELLKLAQEAMDYIASTVPIKEKKEETNVTVSQPTPDEVK